MHVEHIMGLLFGYTLNFVFQLGLTHRESQGKLEENSEVRVSISSFLVMSPPSKIILSFTFNSHSGLLIASLKI